MGNDREKNLQAFVALIGEAMDVLAEKHKDTKHPWPDPGYVKKLKKRTAEGKIPLIVEPGSELSRSGKYKTMGVHERLTRGGRQVGEFIKVPENLFHSDGTINERMGAILVHEYSHALQNVAMGGDD
ncbi:MAG: hypothetical protein KAW41_00615 [Candidatus Diapherotrites archaeon]|nr:hypothetical protein [Candidatus Diapherotrites archaeon]